MFQLAQEPSVEGLSKAWLLQSSTLKGVTAGRELRQAMLVLRSRPWEELGLTRMDVFQLMVGLSVLELWSNIELSGRDGILDEGREFGADSNPPLRVTNRRFLSYVTEIAVPP